jgi:uncharacterized protein (TIGR00730 family)
VAKVTVFGGAAPKPGEDAYKEAYLLGKMLASSGHVVINGGYIGTMEAVSRGAAEAGGIVIGVTSDEIEEYRPGSPNPWITQEMRYPQLRQRLMAMIDRSDAAIALPGGVGTLTEILTTWNHLLIGAIQPRPLILVGPEWQGVISKFLEDLAEYIPESHRKWVQFAGDVETAVKLLDNSHS